MGDGIAGALGPTSSAWDRACVAFARASWSWFSGSGRRRGQLREPHYAVLLDGGAAVYVVADAARRLEGERCRAIQHPDLGAYFDAFAPGVGYVPNERMQRTYPHDAQARRDANTSGSEPAQGVEEIWNQKQLLKTLGVRYLIGRTSKEQDHQKCISSQSD